MARTEHLAKIATRLRIHSLRMTTAAGSGHPTTCLSAADLVACLFFHEMRWNTADPNDPANDEFILSKGHAAPLLWAAYAEAGIIPLGSLLGLRKITSDLEGHPTPRMPWIKAATGSLGQGLSVGVGMALAQRLDKSPARTFVLMGDGECAEGQVWEAAAASHGKLKNLCAVVDVNRLGQSDPTMHQHDLAALKRKFAAFGWEAIVLDGHKIDKILAALKQIGKKGKPTVLLAKTLKGKGISFIEDRNGWHGKPLKADELARALGEIGCLPDVDARRFVRKPRPLRAKAVAAAPVDFPRTAYTERTATRLAYGNALLSLAKLNPKVVAVDGDVKNSTYADKFFEAFPGRAFQSFIAEQNMVGMGMGLAAKGYLPFMATFAAFLSRAHDQVRMAAYSYSNIKLCGSHVGVSIGEDGPSQMGLEDLAMFRPIPGCLVLYPSDAVSSEACVAAAAAHKGMCYIRTSRPATPILYPAGEAFPIGGSKVLRKAERDAVTVVAAGVTVHEALKACDALKQEGIGLRVVDAYSVAPLDADGIGREVAATGGRAVVVEDHYPAGGLGEAVAGALAGKAALIHLCVRELPRSGKPDELLERFGISASHIVRAAKELLGR